MATNFEFLISTWVSIFIPWCNS